MTILVNNAAVVHGKSLMNSDDDALLKTQHINTLGQFWVSKRTNASVQAYSVLLSTCNSIIPQ